MRSFKPPFLAAALLSIAAIFSVSSQKCFGQVSSLLSATAKAEFEKRNFDPCIDELSLIIKREPRNDIALGERARCHLYKGDAEFLTKRIRQEPQRTLAFTDAEQAVAVNPKNVNGFMVRGIIKWCRSDNAGAVADFASVILIDPKNIKAYNNRANVRIASKDYDGAIADLGRIVLIDPKTSADISVRKAAIYYTYKQDVRSAVMEYKIAFVLDPSKIKEVREAADYFKNIEKYRDSIELYDLIISREPRNDDALASRAFCYAAVGEKAKSATDAAAALKINPTNAVALKIDQSSTFGTTVEGWKQRVIDNAEVTRKNAAYSQALEKLDADLGIMLKEYYTKTTPLARQRELANLQIKNCEEVIKIAKQALAQLDSNLSGENRKFYEDRVASATKNIGIAKEDLALFLK